MSETTVSGKVCRLSLSSGRWLATGWDGGFQHARAAYNVSVPEGFDREDLTAYARERLTGAGFDHDGPVLLTGVDVDHTRGARHGSVTAVATVGLSNPARLPVEATERTSEETAAGTDRPPGTVNLLVATTRALSDGTLATALGTAVEAKAATLQATTGFSGTTTDAVAIGCDPGGEPAQFAGSGTDLGTAIRVCVRDAVLASLDARGDPPASVAEADHGVVTSGTATVFEPGSPD